MTSNGTFGRDLSAWLHDDAAGRVPDHLADVLMRTAATRQRPWWSSPERWLPVNLSMRMTTYAWPRLGRVVITVAIILALIAAAIIATGSPRRLPAPFGPARNGAITLGLSGDIYTVDTVDATPRLVVGGATEEFAPTFFRDGSRLGFLRDTHTGGFGAGVMVADANGANVRQIVDLPEPPEAGDVSPDGTMMAFSGTFAGTPGFYLVPVDGSAVPRRLEIGLGETHWLAWRPPVGRELVYVQSTFGQSGAGQFAVYGVAPDGTQRHLIKNLGAFESNAAFNLDPSLTPDGRSVVYATVDDGHFHNHVLDLDTGADRQLTLGPAGGHELHGTVSPDGTQLLFHYADGVTDGIQEMLAPIDGSRPAIRIGPAYPVIDGSAELSQAFSPDGRSILILQGRDREIRVVDAATGGAGRVVSWQSSDLPGWQRLAP